MITDYGDDPAPALRDRVAEALLHTGFELRVLGRSADAVAAYQQVVDRYGDDPAPALRHRLARALVNTGVALGMLGRSADAVAAYQQVVSVRPIGSCGSFMRPGFQVSLTGTPTPAA